MIPGLENAAFARLGGIHRNTFLNSPRLLDGRLRLKADPRLRFAGQITGVEGYVESAAMGLLAGRMAAAERLGPPLDPPPATTAIGALVAPRHRRGGGRDLPADERELRPLPAARRRPRRPARPARPLPRLHRPRQGRLRRLAGAGAGAGLILRAAAGASYLIGA